MKKTEIYKLLDLIEELKKVNGLISLHRQNGASEFMISQYEAKKTQLMGALIDELASPPVQSQQSYLLIKMILNKYYPIATDKEYLMTVTLINLWR